MVIRPLHSGMGVLLVGDGAGVGLAVVMVDAGVGLAVVMVGAGVGSGVWGVGRHAVSRAPDAMHVDATAARNGDLLRMAYRLPIAVLP